jgi:hypothetical protein
MRTVQFVVLEDSEDRSVMDAPTAQKLGITDADSLKALFGERAQWCSVALRPATKRIETTIDRETYVFDPVSGGRKDETLLPQKRAANLIESWSGFDAKFSEEAYLDLAPNIAGYLDSIVLETMYPSAFKNPDFFAILRKLQPVSE